MNMNERNYKRFKAFTDYVIEKASDEQVEYLLDVLADACEYAAEQCKKMAIIHKTKN